LPELRAPDVRDQYGHAERRDDCLYRAPRHLP
jgi:hypothetical protein